MKRPPAAADGIVEDFDVYPRMVQLVACLAEEFEASGLGVACRSTIVPGLGVPFDFCGCDGDEDAGGEHCSGQLSVQLTSAYPTDDFPNATTAATSCGSGMAYVLEVSATMCTQITADGDPPTAEQMLAESRFQLAQMAAMRRAILCCFPGRAGLSPRELVLGAYSPITTGDCIGSAWQVTISGRS